MPSSTHEYPVKVEWTGDRAGSGSVSLVHSENRLGLAVPPEFGGPGGGTNPEEMLTGAVASCYSITFGIVAANRKLPVASFEVEATGEVEQAGANLTFKKITIKPNILVTPGATEAQIAATHEMAMKADNYCIITNAVRGKVEIVVEPTVRSA